MRGTRELSWNHTRRHQLAKIADDELQKFKEEAMATHEDALRLTKPGVSRDSTLAKAIREALQEQGWEGDSYDSACRLRTPTQESLVPDTNWKLAIICEKGKWDLVDAKAMGRWRNEEGHEQDFFFSVRMSDPGISMHLVRGCLNTARIMREQGLANELIYSILEGILR